MKQPSPATIVAVGVPGYGIRDRTDRNRLTIRNSLFRAMPETFRQAKIPWRECYHEDRGDGMLILASDKVPKSLFGESLPSALVNAVHEYNTSHPGLERIRLGMALHAGEVIFDEDRVTSSAIDLTFDLLDSDSVKDAMRVFPGVLAVITSSLFFDEVVRHSVVAAAYHSVQVAVRPAGRSVRVAVKPTGSLTGWICLLDYTDPGQAAILDDDQGMLDDDQTALLFRLYIPSDRLYAAEADKLLFLFRDWFTTVRGLGIRQTGYRTAAGQMYEFFADALAKVDLHEEFNSFSSFLTLCSADPSAAADMLVPMGLKRDISVDFVARFGREVRRLQVDLTHERERRILAIRHSLEEELVDYGVELRAPLSAQINALIEALVPGSSAPESLMLLTVPQSARTLPAVAVNINQQFINAAESTIIQSVRGTIHLGPQAKELLALIDRFGGQEASLLEAAVHELENVNARPVDRSAAKQRLKKFLGQIAGIVHDVGLDLLERYLESKIFS